MKLTAGSSIRKYQSAILALNVFAVVAIAYFIKVTTDRICAKYDARAFLNVVQTIPRNPNRNLVICICLVTLLVISFLARCFFLHNPRSIIASLVLDTMLCVITIMQLDFNYNGLLLWLFASVITYAKDGKVKLIFMAMAFIGYLVADYNLLSSTFSLYGLSDYIRYYATDVQQYLFSFFNVLMSLNIILFIVYCIYVINEQRGTIEQVNSLYRELQDANEQLKEYADMSENMAKTKERNRLAREIHDTLGHTLTGIATGIDACLAIIDQSPEQTKKQLELLSSVSREGIKDIRRSVNELRADALERLSLEMAIQKMISDISQMSDVDISFETEEKTLKYDADEETAIYRVIQESITNSLRHGHAKKIWITMKMSEGVLRLVIKDNGVGCTEIKGGFGTKHIRERIEMLHGTVTFDGSDGFTVSAKIPIRWGEEYD